MKQTAIVVFVLGLLVLGVATCFNAHVASTSDVLSRGGPVYLRDVRGDCWMIYGRRMTTMNRMRSEVCDREATWRPAK